MEKFWAYVGGALGIVTLIGISAFLLAPVSWWELVDRPVLLECTSSSKIKKPISFTPNVGGIIYDGDQVSGSVSAAAVTFSFKNVNGDYCNWTISRINGAGKTACKDKDGKYAFGEVSCVVNATRQF